MLSLVTAIPVVLSTVDWFTKEYWVNTLVYFEETNDIKVALQREKNLKKWNRKWKLELIEKFNPTWQDLHPGLSGQAG